MTKCRNFSQKVCSLHRYKCFGSFFTNKDKSTKNKNPISETIQHIGNAAVREAQRKNREMGIPNVYSKNGTLYYQLPDGTITMDNPLETDPELRRRYEKLRAVQRGE